MYIFIIYISDDIVRRGGQPKNHHVDNMIRIKQAEQLKRLKEQVHIHKTNSENILS